MQLEGRRKLAPPSLESLRPQLAGLLRAERIAAIVDTLSSRYEVIEPEASNAAAAANMP